MVRLLAGLGADPGAPARGGATALHAAAEEGHAEVVRALAEAGADLEARDGRGAAPIDAAAAAFRLGAVRALMEAGASASDSIGLLSQHPDAPRPPPSEAAAQPELSPEEKEMLEADIEIRAAALRNGVVLGSGSEQ
ncbi:unnamed protein product [Prorocentrum cordatum]|uniref:Uncharacterized protein n=1 Tax=Prorocentrum cordatum TaxID=2364126 RepID=A0ABN9YIL5_9DINO|nr:unnamed protein product [Polarella glacialis]